MKLEVIYRIQKSKNMQFFSFLLWYVLFNMMISSYLYLLPNITFSFYIKAEYRRELSKVLQLLGNN